jgi:hypothetical protein
MQRESSCLEKPQNLIFQMIPSDDICVSWKEEGILGLLHIFIVLLTEWKTGETVRLASTPVKTRRLYELIVECLTEAQRARFLKEG